MGYCSCGNWVDEGDICSHCGGGGGYDDTDEDEDEIAFDYYKYYCDQARICSIKEDHSIAIKFYNEALRCTWIIPQKCFVLSAIAGEYEAIEDYDSAEKYWKKCISLEYSRGRYADSINIAGRGDFLYRRGRFKEAIDTYEKVFESLKAVNGNQFGGDELKICARTAHFIIDSYDMLEKDNQKEKYHNELKHGIEKFISTQRHFKGNVIADFLSEKAWKLYEDDGIADEALIIMDSAIEMRFNPPAEYYNIKAIILDENHQYEEALIYYDAALSKKPSNETFLKNKAGCIKAKLKMDVLFHRTKPQDLDLIDEAIKILPENCDSGSYFQLKGDILDQLGEPVEASITRALGAERYDEVEKAEKQLEKLKPTETYINITGIDYYQGFAPFKEGTVADLITEPDNPHDPNAIRVEINGETVGYVANSEHTLIWEVKSATDIKDTNSRHAEVQFILLNNWVIAKLI